MTSRLQVIASKAVDSTKRRRIYDIEPCFADPGNRDYHLKSEAGRWDPVSQTWMQDNITSPCIDAGEPGTSIGSEPSPNGDIINMGAYGGTDEASKSPAN